ncbi:MAG: hypothetical protein IPN95_31155 [Bacteroidetes bacterium]|nr:hypothetical protein [Bacteroidota bacterium]
MRYLIVSLLLFSCGIGTLLGQQLSTAQQTALGLGEPVQALPAVPAAAGTHSVTATKLGEQVVEAPSSPATNEIRQNTAPSLAPTSTKAEEEDAKDRK